VGLVEPTLERSLRDRPKSRIGQRGRRKNDPIAGGGVRGIRVRGATLLAAGEGGFIVPLLDGLAVNHSFHRDEPDGDGTGKE
jgi:hypothetical protein